MAPTVPAAPPRARSGLGRRGRWDVVLRRDVVVDVVEQLRPAGSAAGQVTGRDAGGGRALGLGARAGRLLAGLLERLLRVLEHGAAERVLLEAGGRITLGDARRRRRPWSVGTQVAEHAADALQRLAQ